MPSATATGSFGFGVIALAIFGAFSLGAWVLWILVPLLPIVITMLVIRTKLRRGQRTAEGRAVCDQVEGFQTYLATAEADQLRFEEGEDIFSRYLPWAIIFELADRWAKICADLVRDGPAAGRGALLVRRQLPHVQLQHRVRRPAAWPPRPRPSHPRAAAAPDSAAAARSAAAGSPAAVAVAAAAAAGKRTARGPGPVAAQRRSGEGVLGELDLPSGRRPDPPRRSTSPRDR